MRKLKKLSMMLLVGLVAGLEVGCSSLPPPPEGELFLHRVASKRALCSDLKTGNTCPAVGIESTNNWYMMPPKTFESFQNYIDALVRAVESGSHLSATQLSINTYELRQFNDHLRFVRKTLRR